jgi:dTDP-4-dehydrorhamnose reductase
MKLVVTGAQGQLAREIIRISKAKGCIVIAPDEKELDITDFKVVSRTVSEVRPDIVINCAAYNDVDKVEADWQTAFLVNGIGVKNIALSCNENNAILVHFSTDYVFDGLKGQPYTIADKPNPINRYGESKLLGEELVKNHSERYFLIRTSWVFGEGRFSFPKKVIEWAFQNKKLRIVDDQISSPSYTHDLATAVIDLIQTGNYGFYHITNAGFCSKYTWAELILKTIKWDGEIEPAKSKEFASPAKRPGFSALDNFPLKETVGYLLPSWQDATERFLNRGYKADR